jgi:hypothetical protein
MTAGPMSIATIIAALFAFGLPWLTHFADGGVSLIALFLWAAFLVTTLFYWRIWWLLLTIPFALFWPVTIIVTAGNLKLGF